MSKSEIVTACSGLLENLVSIQDSETLYHQIPQDLQRSLENAIASDTADDSLPIVISSLTQHVIGVFSGQNKQSDEYSTMLLGVLADATRDHPLWRSWFGCSTGRNRAVSGPFILDIARQVLDRSEHSKVAKSDPKNVNSALRLIANCCADDNINRKYFLEQDGMQNLVALLFTQVEIDTVIPTIYNICNDYEDPDSTSQSEGDSTKLSVSEKEVGDSQVSFAASKLAAAYADHEDLTTFELLLVSKAACSANRRAYLAELVEIAVSPIAESVSDVTGSSRAVPWNWQFKWRGMKHSTMLAAEALARENSECQLHVCRAILHLLSQEQARHLLLTVTDSSIWAMVTLFAYEARLEDEEANEYQEELDDCRKQFLKMFYELTTMTGFADNLRRGKNLVNPCVTEISVEFWEWSTPKSSAMLISEKTSDRRPEFLKVCSMIILTQLAASAQLRAELLDNNMLIGTLPKLIETKNEPDLLYPAVAFISRLATNPGNLAPMVDNAILQSMRRLLVGKALGLLVPYETVEAYRLILRARPQYVIEYTHIIESGSVITDMFNLFDRTIEAGTKLAVCEFVIELLRTMFPVAKDCQDLKTAQMNSPESTFIQLLENHKVELGKIFAFVCAEAEPKDHRSQGWFGLGVLSVWQAGRLAIVEAIEHNKLGDAMLEASCKTEGPISQNLKIALAKMQMCHKADMSVAVMKTLEAAADNLRINFVLKE